MREEAGQGEGGARRGKVHFEIGSMHMARDGRGLVLPQHAGVRRKEGSLCSYT